MSATDLVASALDAVSVTRWLWTMKRDRGESVEAVDEAHAAYVRARAVLIELLQREADEDEGAPHASTPRLHGLTALHGTAASDASATRLHARAGAGDRLEATESQAEAQNSDSQVIGSGGDAPHASSTRLHEPASLHGSGAADASAARLHATGALCPTCRLPLMSGPAPCPYCASRAERELEARTSHGVPFGPTAPKYRRLPNPANGNGGDSE